MNMGDAARSLLVHAAQAEEMACGVRMIATALRRTDLSGCAGPAPSELHSRLERQAATAMHCANLVDEVAWAMRDHARAVAGSWVGGGL